MHPQLFYRLLKPILFSLDPETAHSLVTGPARTILSMPGGASYLRATLAHDSPRLRINRLGLSFPGPLGMAAGFDKSGELYPFLSAAGFHFVESGTFTPQPQEGNPRPRLFRFPEQGVLINRMGFNNPGVNRASLEFQRQDSTSARGDRLLPVENKRKVPRGINIGKNKVTANEDAIQDYASCYRTLAPFADYITVNISSPNTPGLRDLQSAGFLKELLSELRAVAAEMQLDLPVLVKLAPDINDADLPLLVESAVREGASGLILTNTTLDRPESLPEQARSTEGGLSGRPLFHRSTDLLRTARHIVGPDFCLVGVGGIDTPQRALEKILAGADLVQIYTGYIFQGPSLPARISKYLDGICKEAQCNLSDLVGQEKEMSHLLNLKAPAS